MSGIGAGPESSVTRPLAGRVIVVTRPRAQAASLREALEDLGAEILLVPTIRIVPRPFDDEVAAVLDKLGTYQMVVFTSTNAVRVFTGHMARGRREMPSGLVVAAVGPATASALKEHGLRCSLMPKEFVAEGLVEALDGVEAASAGARVLLPRAGDARDVLAEALRARGAVVDVLPIYETVAVEELAEPVERVEAADYVTFTSASTAKRLVSLLARTVPGWSPRERLAGTRLCSIGPVTSEALRALGLDVSVEAVEYTSAGLVAAIVADARADASST